MIKRVLTSLAIVFSMMFIEGCSFFAPYTQTIHINGSPADATVVVNGIITSVPASIEVPRNKNLTIIAHKEGYNPYNVTTGYSLSTIGTVDAIGCYLLLLPGLGLLSPGAWELSEDNFYYVLTLIENTSTQKE